jgi:acetyltransferase-like isoleucine patch superfamily enzyme
MYTIVIGRCPERTTQKIQLFTVCNISSSLLGMTNKRSLYTGGGRNNIIQLISSQLSGNSTINIGDYCVIFFGPYLPVYGTMIRVGLAR